MTEALHRPVLLEEAVAFLRVRPGGRYVDCTVGRGGHARAVLERLGPSGRLLALDRDPEAVAASRTALTDAGDRVEVVEAPFSRLGALLDERGWEEVDGILADLGVSSPQLDVPERGFSYRHDGPLDMRMGREGPTAAELLDRLEVDELADILRRYGEERRARRVARAIVAARPVRTTGELARVVASAVGRSRGGRHPARRTFQALRMAVNREVEELASLLAEGPRRLAPGGRMVVVAFHSIEDRMVKQAFRALAEPGEKDPYGRPLREPTHRMVRRRATFSTDDDNPRARSGRVRAIERLATTRPEDSA